MILDVDGTLYDDNCGIEQIIRDNCHSYSKKFGYSDDDCEFMHNRYGSTIRGIIEKGEPVETIAEYYNAVYPDISMRKLRKYSNQVMHGSGYTFNSHPLYSLHKIKDSILVVASNSPVFHVKRVFSRLGIIDLKVDAYITPERVGGVTKIEPTFWSSLLELYPLDKYEISLIDDNSLNLDIARKLGFKTFHINQNTTLAEAVLKYLDVLPIKIPLLLSNEIHSNSKVYKYQYEKLEVEDQVEEFQFTNRQYLEAKNVIDDISLNKTVINEISFNSIFIPYHMHQL